MTIARALGRFCSALRAAEQAAVREGPIGVKHKVDVALRTAISGLIALAAIVVAFGFLRCGLSVDRNPLRRD